MSRLSLQCSQEMCGQSAKRLCWRLLNWLVCPQIDWKNIRSQFREIWQYFTHIFSQTTDTFAPDLNDSSISSERDLRDEFEDSDFDDNPFSNHRQTVPPLKVNGTIHEPELLDLLDATSEQSRQSRWVYPQKPKEWLLLRLKTNNVKNTKNNMPEGFWDINSTPKETFNMIDTLFNANHHNPLKAIKYFPIAPGLLCLKPYNWTYFIAQGLLTKNILSISFIQCIQKQSHILRENLISEEKTINPTHKKL